MNKDDKKNFTEIQLQLMVQSLQQLVDLIHKSKRATLQQKWFLGIAGNITPLPSGVDIKTLYVDNSQNANAITIKRDGDLGAWAIPANSSRYIPAEGINQIQISGQGQCNILAINRELFFGN